MITNFFKPIPKAKLKRLVQDENEDLNSLLESKKSKCDLNAWHSDLPVDWMEAIGEELKKSYYKNMIQKINQESFKCTIYPAEGERFSFMKCLLKNVKVVIIGQDPYHGPGQAHGMCFSVKKGVKLPPSLVNIYRELKQDLGVKFTVPQHGSLDGWATQGVLLMNASLTVRQGEPNSHAKYGWSLFTDAIISYLNKNHSNLVFMLWGGFAKKKAKSVNNKKHLVLNATHPSPLGANKGGWFGCKHFSKANEYLASQDIPQIDWNYLP